MKPGVRFGQKRLVAYLLSRRADPNLAAEPWARPLAWARRKRQTEIAAVLRVHGATA
jgi:hypothetical protein